MTRLSWQWAPRLRWPACIRPHRFEGLEVTEASGSTVLPMTECCGRPSPPLPIACRDHLPSDLRLGEPKGRTIRGAEFEPGAASWPGGTWPVLNALAALRTAWLQIRRRIGPGDRVL
ncbi:hypothetical protein NDU88_004557 [Pleurodeles waltl]|uniref:Uncharacterized protein n=1 Tax=Pleurodeles waltl TaxID=8319 RepID=A0AAV7W5B4_PLEWA|nr:hypothetical protein NDU88_004557 [Pleurodeles waltl]